MNQNKFQSNHKKIFKEPFTNPKQILTKFQMIPIGPQQKPQRSPTNTTQIKKSPQRKPPIYPKRFPKIPKAFLDLI